MSSSAVIHPESAMSRKKQSAGFGKSLNIWKLASKWKKTKESDPSTPSDQEEEETRDTSNRLTNYDLPNDIQSRLICHVPDFVWSTKAVKDTPMAIMTNGVLLFADVSGFTALTERYSNDKEGVSGLTNALNGYISSICQHILDNGGDILKFAGDAILALWKCERKDIAQAIALATHTALEIQHKNDYKMTSVGVELRVKIAISAGKIYCTHVGMPGQMRHIAMSGNPVGEVNAAEKHCDSGDVVMSPNAWELCNRDIFKGNEVGDGRLKFFKVQYMTHKKYEKWRIDSPYDKSPDIHGAEFTRFACALKEYKSLTANIRQYISTTVQKKLDDNQELTYLSEIRQCSILFINLVFDLKEQRRDYTSKLGKTLQGAFTIVDDELRKFGGQLNKLFMFDKGCTFLAAFGLPGQKNEREAAFALECAFQISKRMTRTCVELERVSIGVTTGSVYVGVIGHHERHEYSFLGPKVNMAARIMMAGYPGMVNCDALTMKCSDLSRDFFIPQPYKALKGIKDPGLIYQYLETTPPLTSYLRGNIKPEYPILGRISEIDHIMGELCSTEERCFVLIEGEKGIGKTRLLDEIVILSQNIDPDLHVVSISSSYDIQKDRFKLIRIIIEELLGIIDSLDREDGSFAAMEILATLQKCRHKEFKHVLNPIFGTYFTPETKTTFAPDKEIEIQEKLLEHITRACLDNFEKTVIVIDNGQFIDEGSWPLLEHLAGDSRANVLVSIRPLRKDSSSTIQQIIRHPDNLNMRLAPLSNEYFPALICQMLKVTQISKTLAAGMMYRSYGNPGWLLILLKKLRDEGVIKIDVLGKASDEMHVPPKELTTAQKVRPSTFVATGSSVSKGNRAISRGISRTLVSRSRMSSEKVDEQRTDEFKHPAMQNDTVDEDDLIEEINDFRATRKATAGDKNYRNVLQKIGGYYEKIMKNDTEHEDVEMESYVTAEFAMLSKFIGKIHAPEVIRSFILEQMDQLPPSTQFVCKCAALVGVYFSRQIISSLVAGYDVSKINKAFRELIEANIIEPITSSVNQKTDVQNDRTTRTSSMRRDSSLVNQIKIKSGYECDHLRFKNALYREVIDQLWLNEHRKLLHHKSAEYFKSCIEELKIGDQITEKTIIEFAVNYQCSKDTISRQMSICKILKIDLDLFDERVITYDKTKIKDKLMIDDSGLSTIFTMSKHVHDAQKTTNMKKMVPNAAKPVRLDEAFAPGSIVWARLAHLRGTIPVERELFLSVLCPILINHYMAGRKTEETIDYLLEAVEAYLQIDSIKNALSFLSQVRDIIANLDKGHDIVKDERDGDENFLDLDKIIYVFKVPRIIRARFEMLKGDAATLQGNLHDARKCYNRALRYSEERDIQKLFCMADKSRDGQGLLKLWNRLACQEVCKGTNISTRSMNVVIKRLRALVSNADIGNVITGNTNIIAMAQLGKMSQQQELSEQITMDEIMDLDNFQYIHVLKIFRFLHTIFYNRLSQGELSASIDIAECLFHMSEGAGCKVLGLIARASLCEVFLINGDQKRFRSEIAQIESEMISLGERCYEIEAWLTVLKFNFTLCTGQQIDTFADLVLWLLPFGATTFSNLQWTALSSMISLMNIRICQFDAAFNWLTITDNNKSFCPLSFHYARALGWRVECDLIIFRNSLEHLTFEDWSFAKGRERIKCQETLREYEFICKLFPVFLPQFLLYNGIFHYLTNSKQWKASFAQAKELAQRAENVTALAIIEKAIDYYQNNDDKDLYLWASRIIYSEKKTTDALYVIPKVEN